MMTDRIRIVTGVFVSLAWASVALGQGLYWETKTTGLGNDARVSESFAMPKMMKVINPDGKAVIIRADQDKFITVDNTARTYREMTFAELQATGEAMQTQMEAAKAQMEKQMKSMSAEQRAMMEKMMPKMPGGDAAKAAVVVNKTSDTKTVAGYTCTKYVATESGKPVLTLWTTKDVKGFDTLREDWLTFQKRIAGSNRSAGGAIVDAYTKIEGFPMETVMGDITTQVTKIEARTTPVSEFEVPAGYKKESMNLPKPPQ